MSHSTIATSTYTLVKYSRSYPSPTAQSSNSEWQHYSNPVIRLLLDVKTSGIGELESFRLRVVWYLDSNNMNAPSNQTEMVFEDLDLFSFSQVSGAPYNSQQNLPLRAVYRDTIVGFRYLHPCDSRTPIFRRFQISFASPSTTKEFITAIQAVCPCKGTISNIQVSGISKVALRAVPQQKDSAVYPIDSSQHGMHAYGSQMEVAHFPLSTEEPMQTSEMSVPKAYASPSSDLNGEAKLALLTRPSMMQSRLQPSLGHSDNALCSSSPPQLSNSQPSSNFKLGALQTVRQVANPGLLSAQPAVARLATECTIPDLQTDPLLACLKQASSIYQLPPSTLEYMVGDVIREDGFVALLEKLSTLWKAQSLAG